MRILLAFILAAMSSYALAVDVTFRATWPAAVAPENIDSIKVSWRKGNIQFGSFTLSDPTSVGHVVTANVSNNDAISVTVQFFNEVGGGPIGESPVFIVSGLPELPEAVGPIVVDLVAQ